MKDNGKIVHICTISKCQTRFSYVFIAAAVFLIASLHLKEVVEKMLHKELTCNSCEHQVKSVMRYS